MPEVVFGGEERVAPRPRTVAHLGRTPARRQGALEVALVVFAVARDSQPGQGRARPATLRQ